MQIDFTPDELAALRTWREKLDQLAGDDFEMTSSIEVHQGSFALRVKCEPKPGIDAMLLMAKLYDQSLTTLSPLVRRILAASESES